MTSLGTAYVEMQCFRAEPGNPFMADSLFYLFFVPVFVALAFLVLCGIKYYKYNDVDVARSKATKFAAGCTVMLLFMLQPILVERCALVFSCTRIGKDENDLFMTEDLSVRCWEGTHLTLVLTLGLSFLIFYVIGIPFVVYTILTKHINIVRSIINDTTETESQVEQRHSITLSVDTDTFKQSHSSSDSVVYYNYGFLFIGYEARTYYWEVCVIIRKALISLIGVVLATDQRAQVKP